MDATNNSDIPSIIQCAKCGNIGSSEEFKFDCVEVSRTSICDMEDSLLVQIEGWLKDSDFRSACEMTFATVDTETIARNILELLLNSDVFCRAFQGSCPLCGSPCCLSVIGFVQLKQRLQ